MGNNTIIQKSRIYEIDLLRGLAIVLMVIFHFSYDLTIFGWAYFSTSEDLEWRVFRAIIVSCFLLAVGMSSYLAYQKPVNKEKLAKTVAKLCLVSLLITIGSLLLDPKTWVYFGIIHFIAVALPVSVLFVRVPNLALIIGVISLAGYWTTIFDLYWLWEWSVLNLGIPTYTVDLVSFFPWIGVVLIGVFVMHSEMFHIKVKPSAIANKLVFLGQHSLIIYLIHQPILYGLFGLTDLILGR
ncbi:heparan-alpha-glucosaminide N-acetyltransferase [uncultured Paraglaciecola sp.]|uniref:DUF1624 domain-containing protein n=1 Tax=uncultured Paraglaciecola sp. TaxID=1765024 RepID=UPI0030D991F2|tara:strand:+ start:123096 stop:123815 length:720 start_codon:yes stop_codon:yes gene_type:complete